MKQKIYISLLIKFFFITFAVVGIYSCSTTKELKKFEIEKAILDECPQGGGILDSIIHNRNQKNYPDSIDEYAPFVKFDVNGYDYLFFTSSRNIFGRKGTNFPAELFYSTRLSSMRNLAPNKGWSMPKSVFTQDYKMNTWTRGTISLRNNNLIFAGEEALYHIIPDSSIGNGQFLDLYNCTVYSNGDFGMVYKLSDNVNSTYWETHPCLSLDGNTLYFVSNRPQDENDKSELKRIWYSEFEGNDWSKAKLLTQICKEDCDYVSPFVAPDGMFYFASNKTGNFDIYVCDLNSNDEPIELNSYYTKTFPDYGIVVNTSSDELFPFITEDCKSIYYSSNKPGGYGLYDLYACKLPTPAITLTGEVRVSANICGKESSKINNQNIKMCINGGNYQNKQFSSKETINLEPNENYVVTICSFPNDNCFKYEKTTPKDTVIKTGSAACGSKNEHHIVVFEVEAIPSSDTISIGSTNFITGYWRPMTKNNYNIMRTRAASNFFENAPYVSIEELNTYPDSKINAIDNLFNTVTNKIAALIKQYKECLDNNDFKLRITGKGYTDIRPLGPSNMPNRKFYPDNTFGTRGWTIAQGESMHDIQKGNVKLSRLRAFHTLETIKDEIKNKYPEYKNYVDNFIIEYEGFGIDYLTQSKECNQDACEKARRVDIYIDVLPLCAFELPENKRLPDPKDVVYRPIPQKGTVDIKELAKLQTEKILYPPYRKAERKQCEEYISEYSFKNMEDAQLLLFAIDSYADEVEYEINEFEKEDGSIIYKVQSKNTRENYNDANKESIEARKATSKAASVLKSSWASNKASNCQEYEIVFGMFITKDSAENYINLIKDAGITDDLELVLCEECHNYIEESYDDKYSIVKTPRKVDTYIIRTKPMENYDKVEKLSKKYINLLNRKAIMHYTRVQRHNYNEE